MSAGRPGEVEGLALPARGTGLPQIDMVRGHAELLRLCDELEAIADTLPAELDQLRCLAAASRLAPVLFACHRFEEGSIFPAYESVTGRADIAARLRREHVEDECAAQELAEALREPASGRPVGNCEALGYMLRAFFGSVRRHVAFERDHVLPAIGAAT